MAFARFFTAAAWTGWRPGTVQMLVWALRLAGWVGLASLAQALTAGPLTAFLLVAVWLLALGTARTWVGRACLTSARHRAALIGAGLVVAGSLWIATHGGGVPCLLLAIVAWAALGALATAVARAGTVPEALPRQPPVRAAAAGAVLAWACLGDIGDTHSLVLRLIVLVALTSGLLTLWLPRGSGIDHPSAGRPDCALPAWSGHCWRRPCDWPVGLASFAMLPMMCSLPWTMSLCSSAAAGAQAVLGLHLAAMFLPAVLVVRSRAVAARAPLLCALLLGIGALALVSAPGAESWWVLATTHGAAWSVSWVARSGSVGDQAGTAASWPGAALNALACVTLGAGVATTGLQALVDWPIALGIAALASLAVAAATARRRQISPRSANETTSLCPTTR